MAVLLLQQSATAAASLRALSSLSAPALRQAPPPPRARRLLARLVRRLFLLVALTACAAAAGAPPEPPAAAKQERDWSYTIGVRMQFASVADPFNDKRLRPVVGVRYKRWKLGAAASDDWLRYSSFLKEASLGYDLFDSSRLSFGASLRIHNISSGESWNGYSGGRRTIRGRLQMSYQLTPAWSAGAEVTHDLQQRGDGQTLSMGLSWSTLADDVSRLGFNGGVKWTSSEHLRSAYKVAPQNAASVSSDWSSLGLGASYRRAIAPRLSWYLTLGRSWPLRGAKALVDANSEISGQIGLLYHNKFGG